MIRSDNWIFSKFWTYFLALVIAPVKFTGGEILERIFTLVLSSNKMCESRGWFRTFFLIMGPKQKYLLRLSHLYRDHLYWLIFTLIASRGCCHVVLFTFTFRGVFEFAYLLFNVFSHFDTFFCFMPISFSMFPNSKLLAMK